MEGIGKKRMEDAWTQGYGVGVLGVSPFYSSLLSLTAPRGHFISKPSFKDTSPDLLSEISGCHILIPHQPLLHFSEFEQRHAWCTPFGALCFRT